MANFNLFDHVINGTPVVLDELTVVQMRTLLRVVYNVKVPHLYNKPSMMNHIIVVQHYVDAGYTGYAVNPFCAGVRFVKHAPAPKPEPTRAHKVASFLLSLLKG